MADNISTVTTADSVKPPVVKDLKLGQSSAIMKTVAAPMRWLGSGISPMVGGLIQGGLYGSGGYLLGKYLDEKLGMGNKLKTILGLSGVGLGVLPNLLLATVPNVKSSSLKKASNFDDTFGSGSFEALSAAPADHVGAGAMGPLSSTFMPAGETYGNFVVPTSRSNIPVADWINRMNQDPKLTPYDKMVMTHTLEQANLGTSGLTSGASVVKSIIRDGLVGLGAAAGIGAVMSGSSDLSRGQRNRLWGMGLLGGAIHGYLNSNE